MAKAVRFGHSSVPRGVQRSVYAICILTLSLVAFPLAAHAARACAFGGGFGPRSSADNPDRELLYLHSVRTGAHDCFDRVTFEFEAADDGSGPGYYVRYEAPPIREDGSGRPVEVEGRAFIVVRQTPARDVRISGSQAEPTYRGPDTVAPPGGKHIVEVRHVSSFEATVKWAIGLETRRPFRVLTLKSPTRLVIDVG